MVVGFALGRQSSVGMAPPSWGKSAGLGSMLMLTRHSLDLRLDMDLQLGREAREPQRPIIEGV